MSAPGNLEIERKFLVAPDWQPQGAGTRLEQGYLASVERCVVRVRRAGDEAMLTIKSSTTGIVRQEFEYALPVDDVAPLLELCANPPIRKVRYTEEVAGRTWEIDVFEGANAGLVLAEVELEAADAPLTMPDWAREEVSDDPRYFNSNLAERPYTTW